MKKVKDDKDLKIFILMILENQYSCANEIMQKISAEKLNFEANKFYPTLSSLQLKNFLCTNWLKNLNGENVKYYHITKNGFNYIHQ